MLQNPNPTIRAVSAISLNALSLEDALTWDDSVADPYSPAEIFELIRTINDPEHPLSLEQLSVVRAEHICITPLEWNTSGDSSVNGQTRVCVDFTPTIPHCSMATLIGLCIRVKLWRSLPKTFVIQVRIREGSHQQQAAINKQLNDKERVAAALENIRLASVVQQCLYGPARVGIAL